MTIITPRCKTKKAKIFIKKAAVLYKKCTPDYIEKELRTIRNYRYNLRIKESIYKKEKNVYDCSDYYWKKKGTSYRKIYHLNNLFKFINKRENRRFISEFVIDKFMKVSYMKAIELQYGVKYYTKSLKKTKTSAHDKELFLKKRTIQNTINNLQKYVYNFTRQKYYIIYLLEEKNIPTDLIKILFEYIYYNGYP